MNELLKDLVFKLCVAGANYLLAHARTKGAGSPMDIIDLNVYEDIALMQYNTLDILGFWQMSERDVYDILDAAIEDAKICVGSSDFYTNFIACKIIITMREHYDGLYNG